MSLLKFDAAKCNLCGICIDTCPFSALSIKDNLIEVGASCRMCNVCVKACPEGAISAEEKRATVNKSLWSGVLVFAEQEEGEVHPVTLEVIGEARQLVSANGQQIHVAIVGGKGTAESAELLRYYGVDKIYVYEDEALAQFRSDSYTNTLADCIIKMKPSVVLIGATSLGRSLAPRLSTRFRTGLTADCTKLEMRENSDLVQIRPAFGGNVMAQILVTDTRPQFATVRYKVMETAEKQESMSGEIEICEISDKMTVSDIRITSIQHFEKSKKIEDEDVIVVAGRGVKDEKGVELLQELADTLGGKLGFTRPMVESGFGDPSCQIGLSGRTVKPKLIICCGVSGSIQFASCMKNSDCIVAINTDPDALIFNIAHYCLNNDLYEVVPHIIERLKKGDPNHALSLS